MYEKERNVTYGNEKATDGIYGETEDGDDLFRR